MPSGSCVGHNDMFEIAIDGKVLDGTFSDEEEANAIAAKKRVSLSQKIVVYEIGSARHKKFFELGFTPNDPAPKTSKK